MLFWTLVQSMVSSLGFPQRGNLQVTSLYRYVQKSVAGIGSILESHQGPKKHEDVKHIQLRDLDGRRISLASQGDRN